MENSAFLSFFIFCTIFKGAFSNWDYRISNKRMEGDGKRSQNNSRKFNTFFLQNLRKPYNVFGKSDIPNENLEKEKIPMHETIKNERNEKIIKKQVGII
jgi:hypothetical protein